MIQTLKAMLRKTAEVKIGTNCYHTYCFHIGKCHKPPLASLHLNCCTADLFVVPWMCWETWEARGDSEESVVSHVLLMQERLAKKTELVQENLGRAQKVQNTWYDRNARLWEFKPGDSVSPTHFNQQADCPVATLCKNCTCNMYVTGNYMNVWVNMHVTCM